MSTKKKLPRNPNHLACEKRVRSTVTSVKLHQRPTEQMGALATSGMKVEERRWLDTDVDSKEKQAVYKAEEWNKFRVIAQGKRIRSFVNGVEVADFEDERDASGFIGLQVHSIKKGTGPFEVSWRNVQIRELKPGEEVK